MTETDSDVDIVGLLSNILKARSVAMTIAYESANVELYRSIVDGNDDASLRHFLRLENGNADALFMARMRDKEDEREQLELLQLEALMIETQLKLLTDNRAAIEKIGGNAMFAHMKTTTIMRAMKGTTVDDVVAVLASGL